MKIEGSLFLTGGTGFFGKNLLENLIRSGSKAKITILSRNPERFRRDFPLYSHLNLRFLTGDVRSFPLPAEQFDFILHGATAADAKMIAEQPEETFRTIVDGTRRVLELAERNPSARLLYVSSGAVYGPQPPELPGFPENWQGEPSNAYGRGKLAAEELCMNSGADCTVARCFAFSGKYLPLDKHFAAGNFVNDVLHGRDIMIRGDGTAVRSYLDAEDLSEWLLQLLVRGEHGERYNVGSGDPVTISELAERVLRISGRRLNIRVEGTPGASPPQRYVPDVTKAKKTGLHPTVSLEQSLKKMLDQARRP